ARVVVNYARNESQAAEVVAEILACGGQAEALRFDVANVTETEAAIAEVAKRLGRLDILVANAGISIDGLLIQLKDEALEQQLAVNLKGAIACARAGIKAMLKAKRGRVIFVSSVVGESGNPGQVAYAATKAALLGVTKTLAKEYARRGITVNAVTPGWIETDMTRELSPAVREAMLGAIPLGRPATAREVAGPIVFLASEEASYVTGAVLRVNGGMLT
ncbi:MAG: SDR family oxidoreductase, partial [Myxococcales bacterium]|nr:SDR family oxidoreductase [Polyangiaceae bacterium]MDW8251524.1 SDR family oxidoreductase [Myxococcales bacterium]